MIGFLTGKAKIRDIDKVIILTSSGVGYLVNLPNNSLLDGQDIELYIYTAVSENSISLWGFKNEVELRLFEKLLSVSGGGQKTAQSLIKNVGAQNIANAIITSSISGLKAPGVGQKTAERIVLELKDKLKDIAEGFGNITMSETTSGGRYDPRIKDAMDAVEQLGYSRKDIEMAINKITVDETSTP